MSDTTTELPPAAAKMLRTLREYPAPLYLVHAARGRYAIVSTDTTGRHRFRGAASARTVGQLERAGLIRHDERRESRVDLGAFAGRRRLDGRDGEPVELTEAGQAR